MEQLLCHLVGDYLLQSHWMATQKTKSTDAAVAHCVAYTIPFLFITFSPLCLFLIFLSHFVIDRFNIVKGISDKLLIEAPTHLKTLVGIARDNTVHLVINYLILLKEIQ